MVVIVIVAVGAAAALTVGALLLFAADADEPGEPVVIDGVTRYEVTSARHVDGRVAYPQTPPVGGDHHNVWQNCGYYAAPIGTEHAVHSLEHGAVWITYDPALPADQIAHLIELGAQDYVLVSPWADGGLPGPVVLSAWGVQQVLETVPDPAVDRFLETYRLAPSAPEPGAPCTGGKSETR